MWINIPYRFSSIYIFLQKYIKSDKISHKILFIFIPDILQENMIV